MILLIPTLHWHLYSSFEEHIHLIVGVKASSKFVICSKLNDCINL